MITLNSVIEGKKANFGAVRDVFDSQGCSFCSNFEYDQGKFDAVLNRENGETIYLRVPFFVVEGMLDQSSARIQFGTPYVIKHVVNFGLDYDQNSFVTATTGLDQFQEPLDKDGHISDKSRWEQAGIEVVDRIYNSMRDLVS